MSPQTTKVTDSGGSGISGEPLFGYHIGDVTNYSDYEAMTNSGDDVWYFDVTATWSDHADKKLYYRVQVFDAAGNMSEEERIAPITRRLRPEVKITTTPQLWDSGVVEVKATARDPDPGGRIVSVLFRYSLAVVYVETSA